MATDIIARGMAANAKKSVTALGNKIESEKWIGTKAEWEAVDKSTIKDGTIVYITDDETVILAVNDLNQNKIKSGTIEYTLKKAASSVQIPLNLDFVPKQICVSLRDIGTPSPFQNYCTHVQVYKGAYFAVVCMGPSNGATTVNVPAGTYSIDYIAIV